jgi:branched-chain amino acid transport system substrate-binding protein
MVRNDCRTAPAGRSQERRLGEALRRALQQAAERLLHHDAVLVIADAIERVARSGVPMTRGAMRDAIEATRLDTLQGTISFDKNGDLASRVISVFQIRRDAAHPAEDMAHQFKYIGVAPQDTAS